MSTNHDYEAIGRATVLLASLFAGAAIPTVATETPKTPRQTKAKDDTPPPTVEEPKAADPTPPTEDASPSTPEPQKGEAISGDDFVKQALTLVQALKDNGAKLKELLAEAGVERLTQIAEGDRAAFLEKVELAKIA